MLVFQRYFLSNRFKNVTKNQNTQDIVHFRDKHTLHIVYCSVASPLPKA